MKLEISPHRKWVSASQALERVTSTSILSLDPMLKSKPHWGQGLLEKGFLKSETHLALQEEGISLHGSY